MVKEEAIVEREAGIVKCKRLALVRGSGDDYLSDAHIFNLGTWTSECEIICEEDATAFVPFICSLSQSSRPCW